MSADYCHNQHDFMFVFWNLWHSGSLQLSSRNIFPQLGFIWILLLYNEDYSWRKNPLCALFLRCIRSTMLSTISVFFHKGNYAYIFYFLVKVKIQLITKLFLSFQKEKMTELSPSESRQVYKQAYFHKKKLDSQEFALFTF